MTAESERQMVTISDRIEGFVSVVAEPQTYLNLVYLALAFTLGMVYFTIFTFAFAFGIALAIFLVGFVVLLFALVGSRFVAEFERILANVLLKTDIESPPPIRQDDPWSTIVVYTTAGSTWRGLGFLALKFWIGLVSGLLVIIGIGVTLGLLSAPVASEPVVVMDYTIDSTVESFLAVPVGILFGLAFLHVANATATLSASMAVALLDESDGSAVKRRATEQDSERV